MNIGEIATNIYNSEFSGISGAPNVSSISGWLSGHIGDLNIIIYQNFTPSGEFCQEEAAILESMYLNQYYTKLASTTLKGIGLSSNDWIAIREGDSEIKRSNRNEAAKTYMALAKTQKDNLNELVAKYNIYEASPVQVAGEDGNYPTLKV
jgi:hypothetical protein